MVEQLRIALVSRGVIDQAKGIIMAARGIGAEAAFGILVRQSQQQNRKVRDLAEEFVRTAIQPT
jgi:AmiR/NasT family two-component response regulator